MPLNLDTCITGIFVPGSIGASSGLPPIVRVMPSRPPTTVTASIVEAAAATALISSPAVYNVAVAETAAAASTQDAVLVGAPLVSRSAMVLGLWPVFVNSPGTLREADVGGVMVNL